MTTYICDLNSALPHFEVPIPDGFIVLEPGTAILPYDLFLRGGIWNAQVLRRVVWGACDTEVTKETLVIRLADISEEDMDKLLSHVDEQ